MKVQKQISCKSYISDDGFVGRYRKLIKNEVIPYQYSVLWDKAEGAEKSHVAENFINAASVLRGESPSDGFYGMVFQDSDAAKWIEAAAYSLVQFPDKKLEEEIDGFIDIIADAQDEDGYLDTYFTVKDKDKRWTNLLEGHELYCSGHMMEAACAYYEVTGKDKLLKVMEKNAEHIYKHFITEKNEGYPGHPEVELALMKMYRVTGNEHCLELAEHFINTRGTDAHFYEKEAEKRNWTVWGNNPSDTDYCQASKPVREQTDAAGHAVRAVYLYTGMADLASKTDDKALYGACKKLWESITRRRMYVTGGIGSTAIGEAFSVDNDLPSDTAYCETCASIGLIFFASRMLENEVRGEYADVMERAFYNTVLAGIQLDGKRFFYVNPLECVPGISGVSPTHRHDLTERPKWYACACCPPNAARLISSIGCYAYGENSDTAFCHLYAGGEVSFENGIKISCTTDYPYGFTVKYKVLEGEGRLAVRVPARSRKFEFAKNGEKLSPEMKDGYGYIPVSAGDEIELTLDETPYFVYARRDVPALTGRTALCRGPLVYCFEGVDNDGDVLSLTLKRGEQPKVKEYDPSLLGGISVIEVSAMRADSKESVPLYSLTPPEEKEVTAKAVPYYAWCNRGENQMRVWMNEK